MADMGVHSLSLKNVGLIDFAEANSCSRKSDLHVIPGMLRKTYIGGTWVHVPNRDFV